MCFLRIKAVLFDLGNTLVEPWIPEIVFQRILNSLGIRRSVSEVKEALAKTEAEFNALGYRSLYGKLPYKEYWHKWDSWVLEFLGVPAKKEHIEEILSKWFDYAECKMHPDVAETLLKLKKLELKLGLVSTGYEEDIHTIFEKINLQRELFDVIIGVNTIKKEKPHPEVFRYALAKLNVEPSQALFVGDNVDTDYKGAEKAGLKAILIQRTKSENHSTKGFRVIKSLKEIFKYIE